MNLLVQKSRFRQVSERASSSESAIPFTTLRLWSIDPQLPQRQLSQALGLSLGKTLYVLHTLLDKGLLKIQRFRRNDNKLAYACLVAPKGLKEKLGMARTILADKKAEYKHLQAMIEPLQLAVQHQQTSKPNS